MDKIILSDNPEIFTIKNFLNSETINRLINYSHGKYQNSEVLFEGKHITHPERKGLTYIHNQQTKLFTDVIKKVSSIININRLNCEFPQIIKYVKGDFYEPHYDSFDYSHNRNSQRIKTALILLKKAKIGGNTIFPHIDISVDSEPGDILVFDNCFPGTANLNPGSFHGGEKVESGEKIILSLWFRDKIFKIS